MKRGKLKETSMLFDFNHLKGIHDKRFWSTAFSDYTD